MPRPRLFERLNEGLETNGSTDEFQPFKRKLTLVTAPAGWISLDENDNNLEVLIRYVIAAIRT